jgi:hypothetical protein
MLIKIKEKTKPGKYMYICCVCNMKVNRFYIYILTYVNSKRIIYIYIYIYID